ncbi:MAG: DUF2953 domain-containing protein [Vicinamibacterales bacterium]
MWVLLAGAAVVVALGLVPIDLEVDAEAGTETRGRLRIDGAWLWGLVRFHRRMGGDVGRTPSRPPSPTTPAERPRATRRRRRSRNARRWWRAIRTPGLARRASRLVAEILSACWPRRVDAEARMGLDDPADTGALFGVVAGPLAMALGTAGTVAHAHSGTMRVRVVPVFDASTLWAHVVATFRVRPVALVAPVATFLCSRPVRRAFWAGFRAR